MDTEERKAQVEREIWKRMKERIHKWKDKIEQERKNTKVERQN